ncbi:MAG: hypothetical protein AAGC55_32730 [Myxococcota bacterium]
MTGRSRRAATKASASLSERAAQLSGLLFIITLIVTGIIVVLGIVVGVGG